VTDPFEELERARRVRRILSFAAALALLSFVGFAVFPNLLDGPGEPESVDGQVAAVVVEQGGATPPLALLAGDAVETFEVFGGKNPFTRPLSLPSTPTSTTEPGSGSSTSTTTTVPGSGSTSTTVPPPPDPADQQPTRGQAVALLDVYDDALGTQAQVRVGSTVYLVGEGDVFAVSFKVVSLDLATGCGRFLFGDSPFDLCKGQEILK
jgi:hypothetical protein